MQKVYEIKEDALMITTMNYLSTYVKVPPFHKVGEFCYSSPLSGDIELTLKGYPTNDLKLCIQVELNTSDGSKVPLMLLRNVYELEYKKELLRSLVVNCLRQ